MGLATDIFCTLEQCWIGEGIDDIYIVATTLLEIAIKLYHQCLAYCTLVIGYF